MINELINSIPQRFRLCLRENGRSISRILHQIHQYNNETVPNINEVEALGLNTPRNFDASHINEVTSVVGIVGTINKMNELPNYYTAKLFDHPKHLDNQEMATYIVLVIKENLKDNITSGKYYCMTGKFVPINDLIVKKRGIK